MTDKWRKYFTLLFRFAEKDLKVRYKSTFLGFFWALLVPLSTMLVFSLIFSRISRGWNLNVPYPVFLISGLFPWFFFSMSVSIATTSLVDNSNLLKKVYFNRTIIPISVIASNFFNFIINLVLLIIFILILKIKISVFILLIFIPVILQVIFTTGLVLGLSSLFIKYRDIKYAVEILIFIWFYLTPIFYPIKFMYDNFPMIVQKIVMLNPMTNIVILYRDLLFNSRIPDASVMYGAVISCTLVFILGLMIFKKNESKFADLI